MSESATEAPTTETVGEEPKPKPTETVDFWKSKAREQETRAKANADAARELVTLKQSQMSDAERLNQRTTELEQALASRESELTRLRVAQKYGINEDDMVLLGSGTEDEIEARAKRVAELSSAVGPNARAANSRPVESLRPGATPADLPLNGDPLLAALKAKIGIA